MICALTHLAINLAIPLMAAGLLITVGGSHVSRVLEDLLPAQEDW